jgi:hypothetical protein
MELIFLYSLIKFKCMALGKLVIETQDKNTLLKNLIISVST